MEYGVEAYCPAKHMKKEDGSYISAEEKSQFLVLEFNKDSKKILVSHTKVWGDVEAKELNLMLIRLVEQLGVLMIQEKKLLLEI